VASAPDVARAVQGSACVDEHHAQGTQAPRPGTGTRPVSRLPSVVA